MDGPDWLLLDDVEYGFTPRFLWMDHLHLLLKDESVLLVMDGFLELGIGIGLSGCQGGLPVGRPECR
jgi:hypothetical protein